MNEAINIKGTRVGRLAVFDLDDTLIISSAKIQVLNKRGKVIKSLTPAEFNFFKLDPKKHSLSFDDFENSEILREANFITHVLEKLKDYYGRGIHVCILTARSSSSMIRNFFLENGIDIHPDLVIAVNDPMYKLTGSIAEKKSQALRWLIDHGYHDFIFFDDNQENLDHAKELEKESDVKVETVKV
jgi:FMN phosphatase YigB (HAD superfamily)